jgi:hypothetical protein
MFALCDIAVCYVRFVLKLRCKFPFQQQQQQQLPERQSKRIKIMLVVMMDKLVVGC